MKKSELYNEKNKLGKHRKSDVSENNLESSRKQKKLLYKKQKRKKIVITFFIIVFLFLVIISVLKILHWFYDSKNTKSQLSNLDSISNVTDITDEDLTNNVEFFGQEEDPFNPYWDYIKMNLIDVDFSKLKDINSDTKGWIQVNGTNVNYPFVQYSNNDYYLNHSFDKTLNDSGWIFLDYRNNINSLNKHTIIYGHSRYDTTMFGSLKNILNSNWYKNSNNYIIKLSTETDNTLWQIFSLYNIETTNDYLTTDFSSENQFTDFVDLIKNRSLYNFNCSVSKDDKILTLSTCYKSNQRVVLHGKLIKKSAKNN